MAHVLGLTPLLDRLPRQLSGGQQQRVALGRALIRRPRVFLMDEPLSNLDAKLRAQMRGEIKRLHRQFPITTIYVTHDQAEAMALSDRVAVMNRGVLVQVGPPAEIYHRPSHVFVAGFVGAVPMNLARVRLHRVEDAVECLFPGGQRAVRVRLDGTPPADAAAVLGVRPQHARWAARPSDDGVPWIPAVVEDIDIVGEESYVLARVEHGPLLSVLDRAGTAAPGQSIAIAFEPAAVHLFDEATGHAVPVERVTAARRGDSPAYP